MAIDKQQILKPQDLVVTLKIAVNQQRSFLLAELADELSIAVSGVHGSVVRAEQARLISRAAGGLRAVPGAAAEFVVHGAKYCFPGAMGAMTRGIRTSIAGPVLLSRFEQAGTLPPVWPFADGDAYGPAVVPLHPSVPVACRRDPALYDVLSLLDALRTGAAREREMAALELQERLG